MQDCPRQGIRLGLAEIIPAIRPVPSKVFPRRKYPMPSVPFLKNLGRSSFRAIGQLK